MPRYIARVHLGYHERHVRIHAKRARIIDHHGTRGNDGLAHLLRNACSARKQSDVHILKRFGGHLLHGEFTGGNLPASGKLDLLARRTRRSKRAHFGRGKIEVVQHLHEFLPDRPGCTRNGDHGVRRHHFVPSHLIYSSSARQAAYSGLRASACENPLAAFLHLSRYLLGR